MKLEKLLGNKKIKWEIWGIWLLLNLSLLIIASRQTAVADSRIANIYPFNYHIANTCLWAYDITEFIGYALILPPIITFLFKKIQKAEKSCFNSNDDICFQNLYHILLWICSHCLFRRLFRYRVLPNFSQGHSHDDSYLLCGR